MMPLPLELLSLVVDHLLSAAISQRRGPQSACEIMSRRLLAARNLG
jgi:hypothetical protein